MDKSVITTGGDKAIATVTVADEDGIFLEGIEITANCNHCLGVKVGEFSYEGHGVYTAEIISSSWLSNGWVEVVVSNEYGRYLWTLKTVSKIKKNWWLHHCQWSACGYIAFIIIYIHSV